MKSSVVAFTIPRRLHGWLLCGATAILCVAGGLALVGLPLETTKPALDPSWVEAYVHFTKTGAQAGVDYLFTYGPLGHFIAPAYDPELYLVDIAMAVVIATLLIAPLGWAAVRRRSLLTTVFLFWIAVLLTPRYMGNEVGSTVATLTTTFLLLESPRKSARMCALVGVVFALFSLMKFTMLVMCAASMGTLTLQWWFTGRKGTDTPIWIAALLGSYGLAFIAFWLLAGQNLFNLPAYLMASIEVSRAYVKGMHTPLNPRYFWIGISIASLVTLQIGLMIARGRRDGTLPYATLFFACLALLLSWKMGVARSQPPKFYVPAAAIAVLLATPQPGSLLRQGIRQALPLLVLAAATLGTLEVFGRNFSEHLAWSASGISLNAYRLAAPMERRKAHDWNYTNYRKAYAYPEIRAIAGEDTLDMFTSNQSIVMFNDLNYHPRPVFQGYQACIPRLAQLNGDFYHSPDAPRYVMRMAKLEAIDGRFPTSEDPETLKALFLNYRPVHWERYFVLLEKVAAEERTEYTPVGPKVEGTARLNEWISIDDPGENWQMLALHLKPSLTGRVRELVFQPPMPLMEVRHSDGSVAVSRVNIGSIEGGFLINPVFELVESVEDWPGVSSTRRVEAIRVTVAQAKDWVLQPDFGYSVETVAPLAR